MGRRVGEGALPVGSGEGAPDAAGDGVLEAAEGFHDGLALFAEAFVVVLAWSLEADLGDGDAVDRAVQLPVSATVEADSTEPPWVRWRLWSFDSDQGFAALLRSVERSLELDRWEIS